MVSQTFCCSKVPLLSTVCFDEVMLFSEPIQFNPINTDALKLSRKGSLGDDVAMATGEEVKHKSQ